MPEVSQPPRRPPTAIRHFTELIVWQKSHRVALEVFRLPKAFPPEERYALTDQVRRSSRAIGAKIAEAWGKRRYEAAFVAKLVDADAEAHETEHWLINACAHGYCTEAQVAVIRALLLEVGRMLGSMMNAPATCLTKRPV